MTQASKKFTDLRVWQQSHQIALLVYKATKTFPKEELFSLTNQMRRCAVSVPSNIAEGFNRISSKEKVQFYNVALGSLAELQSQIMLARDLGYFDDATHWQIEEQAEIGHKLLVGLIKSIQKAQ